jgi:DNA mismatch repair ATPase MutS
MEYLDSKRNLIVKSIDPFVLWTFQCACAVEAWRKRTGPAVRRWLAAVGEFEALSSLGGYAYEHPADVFPEFADTSPCFEAEGLAHPLLPDRDAVRNDLRFGTDLRVLIISGPNMAGKSTFVRAVGINAVLAQCGAPVRARRLRLSPLAVGASICVLDSLQGGISRFYAEIRRLKQIVDLTEGSRRCSFCSTSFCKEQTPRTGGWARRRWCASPGGTRGDRTGHHARPGAGADRGGTRPARRQRPFRGSPRGWETGF